MRKAHNYPFIVASISFSFIFTFNYIISNNNNNRNLSVKRKEKRKELSYIIQILRRLKKKYEEAKNKL